MPRGQALDAVEQGALAGDVSHVHGEVERGFVQLGRDQAAFENSLGFRAESELAGRFGVEQGFDAQRVSDQKKRA